MCCCNMSWLELPYSAYSDVVWVLTSVHSNDCMVLSLKTKIKKNVKTKIADQFIGNLNFIINSINLFYFN